MSLLQTFNLGVAKKLPEAIEIANEPTFDSLVGSLPQRLQVEYYTLSEVVKLFPNTYSGDFGEKSYDGSQLSDSDKKNEERYDRLTFIAKKLEGMDTKRRLAINLLNKEDFEKYFKNLSLNIGEDMSCEEGMAPESEIYSIRSSENYRLESKAEELFNDENGVSGNVSGVRNETDEILQR